MRGAGALGLVVVGMLALAPARGAGEARGPERPFPPMPGGAPLASRAALGRLLFFDPVLSGDRDLACASCHAPARAFTDGRRTARGAGGRALPRNTPTLYNVGYKQRLFWDRRAASLEAQALGPLLSPKEMGADPQELARRLARIPEYRRRFSEAFQGEPEPVSAANVARALAAFERTLVSRRSRYDRYVAGDRDALTAAERRGLTLFHSLNTRCFECHRPPTFQAPLAMGVGVPSSDDGVGGHTGVDAQRGLFAVPTLRNVARTAPYMHDGSLATLEEVVDFYRRGGGRAHGVDPGRVHEHVRPFDIRDDEARDLVAFLRALTDESGRPEAPEAVPSGLPVPNARSDADSPDSMEARR